MSELVIILALNGLVWGLIIALIALGLSIIFGLLNIINVAHGDFFMVGTVLAWTIMYFTGNFWIGFLIVPLLGLALGALIERGVMRPIENSADLTIVVSFGIIAYPARNLFALLLAPRHSVFSIQWA